LDLFLFYRVGPDLIYLDLVGAVPVDEQWRHSLLFYKVNKIIEIELIQSQLLTLHNIGNGEIQQKKENGKSNGNERVVLENFCNDFVVVRQETREGNRGDQGWKFRKWQDFSRSEQ